LAAAAPMPRLAPVTMADLPANSLIVRFLGLEPGHWRIEI
jgi:hypothetical protein